MGETEAEILKNPCEIKPNGCSPILQEYQRERNSKSQALGVIPTATAIIRRTWPMHPGGSRNDSGLMMELEDQISLSNKRNVEDTKMLLLFSRMEWWN